MFSSRLTQLTAVDMCDADLAHQVFSSLASTYQVIRVLGCSSITFPTLVQEIGVQICGQIVLIVV